LHSLHYLQCTPSLVRMRAKVLASVAAGADIFKVATRTDSREQLARLLHFFDQEHLDLPISAMGIGRFGRRARVELARRGSALVYVSVGRSHIKGQLSIRQLRSALAAFKIK